MTGDWKTAVELGLADAFCDRIAHQFPVPMRLADRLSTLPSSRDLSPRQGEVLELLAGGDTYQEIADQLGITHATAGQHVRDAMRALGARNATHAVVIFLVMLQVEEEG